CCSRRSRPSSSSASTRSPRSRCTWPAMPRHRRPARSSLSTAAGRRTDMATKKLNGTKAINLALQGGGAHGAFAWGAIDSILEDNRIDIEAISATSAGAMIAVVLADALTDGDRDHARERLAAFWKAIAAAGHMYSPV